MTAAPAAKDSTPGARSDSAFCQLPSNAGISANCPSEVQHKGEEEQTASTAPGLGGSGGNENCSHPHPRRRTRTLESVSADALLLSTTGSGRECEEGDDVGYNDKSGAATAGEAAEIMAHSGSAVVDWPRGDTGVSTLPTTASPAACTTTRTAQDAGTNAVCGAAPDVNSTPAAFAHSQQGNNSRCETGAGTLDRSISGANRTAQHSQNKHTHTAVSTATTSTTVTLRPPPRHNRHRFRSKSYEDLLLTRPGGNSPGGGGQGGGGLGGKRRTRVRRGGPGLLDSPKVRGGYQ